MTSPETRTASFDLLDEPWLPVSLLSGGAETWSLLDLFGRAQEARGLSEPSPLSYTATMRFLIAILHRSYDGPANPAEWAAIREAGQFDIGKIAAYLEKYRDRFDLFHPERPFAQAISARGKLKDIKPITQLSLEQVSGNNVTLYDHSIDDEPNAVSPGDAARLILTAHQYGFAGSAARFYDTAMVAGYCLLLEGRHLFETLALNLQQYDDANPLGLGRDGDAPWWELKADLFIERDGNRPLGLTDLLTWRGRQILLIRDDDGHVRRTWYRGGYHLRRGENIDPFKRCIPSRKLGEEHLWIPRSFQESRVLWRDSYAFFPEEHYDSALKRSIPRPAIISWLDKVRAYYDDSRDAPLSAMPSLSATGIVKATKATVKLWRIDRQPIPLRVLGDADLARRVEEATQLAERVCGALNFASGDYAGYVLTQIDPTKRQKDDPKPNADDVTRELTALRFEARYWSALDRAFQIFLTNLADKDPDAALDGWRRTLRRVATDTYFDATDQTNTDGVRMAAQSIGGRALKREVAKALGITDQTVA